MEELEYKQDIINTRTGNVGSSDARMIQQIAELGVVPNSAIKRMAIIKGLTTNPDITTPAMRYGDFIEMQVYEHLKATDERWQSNPCIVSKKYSRKNCGCLTHIDFLLQDDENKVLTVGEAKATKLSFAQARDEYQWQIYHHYLLAQELVKELGDYKVKIALCVYDTNDVDYADFEFDASRLTVKILRNMEKLSKSYHLSEAMDIIDNFLETFNEYYEDGEEIPYEILPANVQNQFDSITTLLTEIKEREDKVAAFKSKLYDFLTEKNIKSIKNNDWSIVRIDPTESVQFDNKRYLEDFSIEHPRQYKKIRNKYDKVVKKKGYVSIKIKDKKS